MKEIGTISLERMNNGAHYMYLLLILEKAEADATLKTKVSGLTADLREAVTKEDECLKLSQKSLLSDKIQAADGQRDALYSGYKKGVDGYADFPVAALAESAKVLAQHIKDYDIDPKMQLDKETGLLINFIADLEGKFAEHVTALALTPFVTNMKTANEAVRSLTASRTDERTVVEVGALKKARAASDTAYKNLVKMVNALAMVEGDANYAAFIDYVNTEIVHYKREVLGQTASKPGEGADISPDNNDERPGEL
ncbi:DUF6261 family protein [uncultured Parabacteroides sp.]|uniref:Cell surface protein n=2 Tax=Parabacteroides hominis TaxID=2763057 RepID=A0ABR7DMD8_9BACT|nr:DUF6261 family protein [uncultured Parabacteroides sp.]MBC5632240.1 hypothetical protein [Parabacteroides hominis]